MPELRAVQTNEIDWVAELYNNAYRVGMPTARAWVQGLPVDQTIAIVEPRRVASIVRMIPYRIWVGGNELAMGGVGGVATWADCQGKGYAGTLMRESVRLMRERGDVVSVLYPFSHRYYRKFGWETSGEKMILSDFTQADLQRYEEKELVRACLEKRDIDLLDAVYREYAVGYNGMALRNRANWEGRLNGLAEARGQAWIIEDDNRPIGYFFCENRPLSPTEYESRTTEFACVSPRARRAMFGFLAALPTNVKTITLMAPTSPSLLDHFKEPFFSIQCRPSFQFRVLDVEKAVAGRGYDPEAKGGVAIEVADECAEWNAAVWSLEFGGGRGQATKSSSAPPDLTLSIQQFSRLFVGAVDPVTAARDGVFPSAAPPALKLLRDAFRDRTPFLADAF